MNSKADLIKVLKDSHASMQKVVDIAGVDDHIYPPWKIKEILAHLSGWDDYGIITLKALAQGEVPEDPAARGFDVYNAETVSTRETLSYEQTCREWSNTRLDFIKATENATDDILEKMANIPGGGQGTMANLIRGLTAHEISHAEEIQAILENK
jgi:hypothetical protein